MNYHALYFAYSAAVAACAASSDEHPGEQSGVADPGLGYESQLLLGHYWDGVADGGCISNR